MVNAPKNQVNPKRVIIVAILISVLNATLALLPVFCLIVRSFLQITLMTATNMTKLKIRMANIGPRKAPKNTRMSLMKQLYAWVVIRKINS